MLVALDNANASRVTSVELSYLNGATVAKIGIDGPIRFTHQTEVAKDGKSDRVIVDILAATHELGQKEFVNLPVTPVTSIRTSQYSASPEQVVRIVFDLNKASLYKVDSDSKSISVMFTDNTVQPFPVWSSQSSITPILPDVKPSPATIAKSAVVDPIPPVSLSARAAHQNKAMTSDRLSSLGVVATTPPNPKLPTTPPSVTQNPNPTPKVTPPVTALRDSPEMLDMKPIAENPAKVTKPATTPNVITPLSPAPANTPANTTATVTPKITPLPVPVATEKPLGQTPADKPTTVLVKNPSPLVPAKPSSQTPMVTENKPSVTTKPPVVVSAKPVDNEPLATPVSGTAMPSIPIPYPGATKTSVVAQTASTPNKPATTIPKPTALNDKTVNAPIVTKNDPLPIPVQKKEVSPTPSPIPNGASSPVVFAPKPINMPVTTVATSLKSEPKPSPATVPSGTPITGVPPVTGTPIKSKSEVIELKPTVVSPQPSVHGPSLPMNTIPEMAHDANKSGLPINKPVGITKTDTEITPSASTPSAKPKVMKADTTLEDDSWSHELAVSPAEAFNDKDEDALTSKPLTSRFRRDATSNKLKGTMIAEFPQRLVIKYHQAGNRDPFATLINDNQTYNSPMEQRIPNVEGLKLVGVIESPSRETNRALFEDKDGYSYILKSGDKVRNGYVLRVESDQVFFQVFEYGWSRTLALKIDEF